VRPLRVCLSVTMRAHKSLRSAAIVGVIVTLLLNSAYTAEAIAASPTSPPWPESPPVQIAAERPDRVSAALTARLQGSRVLITGETTESTLTYANADGTLTTEAVTGVARVKQGDRWVPVDTTLVEQDGVLKPRAAKADIEFSAGGEDKPLARFSRSATESLSLGWPGPLPKPEVEGNKAVSNR
jgi:hypothetical protein